MYSRKIFKTEKGQWGYDILVGDTTIIHQDIRPAVAGTENFKSKEDAEKIADLVVAKLENNLSPAVTPEQVVNANELEIGEEINREKKEKAMAKIRLAPTIVIGDSIVESENI